MRFGVPRFSAKDLEGKTASSEKNVNKQGPSCCVGNMIGMWARVEKFEPFSVWGESLGGGPVPFSGLRNIYPARITYGPGQPGSRGGICYGPSFFVGIRYKSKITVEGPKTELLQLFSEGIVTKIGVL